MSKEKIITAVVIVLVVVGGIAYAVWGRGGDSQVAETTKVESVAKVNGVEISKKSYDDQVAAVVASLKSQGQYTESTTTAELIKNQVLNDLIGNELLTQGAKAYGTSTTQAEVDAQVSALVTQVGGQDKFKEELTKASLTEAQLRENISKQLTIQKYLLANINLSTATATDAEITAFYNTNVKGQTGAPALKDIKEQIKQQIINTKQQTLIVNFVAQLRAQAQVETSI